MKNAFDVIYEKNVDAGRCGCYTTVTASSHRFICPYCDEWVTLALGSIQEPHFRHTKGDINDCENRAQQSDSAILRYYSPETSFGLPLYLIGSKSFSLKIGFLQRSTGMAILTNSSILSKTIFKNGYPLNLNTLNHYVYLQLERQASTYYIHFNSKPYYGEGLSPVNIFYEKTRRRLRTVGDSKEALYTGSKYIMMIEKDSQIFNKNIGMLSNTEWFAESNDFVFDHKKYAILTFLLTKDQEEMIDYLKKAFDLTIKSGNAELRFLWPLNISYQETKKFLYDNELYALTKNVSILKTNTEVMQWNRDKSFSYKLNKKDGVIGWNENKGFMYQMDMMRPVTYNSFTPEIYLYDKGTGKCITSFSEIRTNNINVHSNVKCRIVKLGAGVTTYQMSGENNKLYLTIDIPFGKDDYAIYVLYGNKAFVKIEKEFKKNTIVVEEKKIDYKKALMMASFDTNMVEVNQKIINLSKKIKNKQLAIYVKNSVVRGKISASLQTYLLEELV